MRSNIESIKKNGGLLSLGALERRGIEIPVPGGNQWSHDADKMKGLHEYVHLAFVDDHPMLFRSKQEGRIKVNQIFYLKKVFYFVLMCQINLGFPF